MRRWLAAGDEVFSRRVFAWVMVARETLFRTGNEGRENETASHDRGVNSGPQFGGRGGRGCECWGGSDREAGRCQGLSCRARGWEFRSRRRSRRGTRWVVADQACGGDLSGEH